MFYEGVQDLQLFYVDVGWRASGGGCVTGLDKVLPYFFDELFEAALEFCQEFLPQLF